MLRPDRATIPREKDSGSGAATTDTDLSKSAKSIMRALALLAAVASAGPAAAQAVDCNRLALQIATVGRSQAPTAGGESSGIAIEDSAKPLARGEVRDETGPDGRPRRMRVLGQ